MIVYRLQISTKLPSWHTEWYPTKAIGLHHFADAVKTKADRDVFLDAIDVPTEGREAVATALNMSWLERSSWEGESIKKHLGLSPNRADQNERLPGLKGLI